MKGLPVPAGDPLSNHWNVYVPGADMVALQVRLPSLCGALQVMSGAGKVVGVAVGAAAGVGSVVTSLAENRVAEGRGGSFSIRMPVTPAWRFRIAVLPWLLRP